MNDSTIASSISWWQGWHLFHCISSRSARNVKDTCWPIVTCFSNIQRTYKNMDVHSVHNASCLYVHVWAQERDKEVNYACRCRVAQSTAKHLLSDFQTENTTHEFDMAKNHCRRDLQTEGWTHQQKTSLTKLGNKKLSSSATPSCIISQCLCIRISTASDDADDAVPCSIRTDVPVSKWNSDHKTSTNVTGAWLQTNILHSEIPRHAYLFAWFQNNAMTCLISKQNWTVQYWTVQWFPYYFFVHCSCISMKTSHIFFCRAIHHIDPLHRKQTLTLSQCNSRALTDSPYRNLEKCKKCYRYPFANRHLFHEHSAYI